MKHKVMNRVYSIFLTCMMVVGMLPMMSEPVFAYTLGANKDYFVNVDLGITANGVSSVVVNGYSGVYDGEKHGISIEGISSNHVVLYKVNEDDAYTLENPLFDEIGIYTVYYQVKSILVEDEVLYGSATVEIKPVNLTITADDITVDYLQGIPDLSWQLTSGSLVGDDVLTGISISREEGLEVGDYTIVVSQMDGANPHYNITFVNGTLKIRPIHMVDVAVEQDGVLEYNGLAQVPSIFTYGLTVDNSVVTYTYSLSEDCTYGELPSFVNAGEYTVYYKATCKNYKTVYGSFVVTMNKVTNEWISMPTMDDWTYGEEASEVQYEVKVGEVEIHYEGTANDGSVWNSKGVPTKAGKYIVTVEVKETDNYTGLSYDAEFTIVKAKYDMSKVRWDYDGPIQYDGKDHSVYIDESTLPSGLEVNRYTGNTAMNVGDYTANVSLSYDIDNYEIPEFNTIFNWCIVNDWVPTQFTTTELNEYGYTNETFFVIADDGYELSEGNLATDYFDRVYFDRGEENKGSVTIYLRNKETGAISLPVTIPYKIDHDAPYGTVYFDDVNRWSELVNDVTFDLVFKEPVSVNVLVNDLGSGIKMVDYYVSSIPLTKSELEMITDWKMMSEQGLHVACKDGKEFIYYIRIKDRANNIAYISTNGAQYDLTSPTISNVKEDEIYYTSTKVVVKDKNLDKVTVNGDVVDETFTLFGNVDKTYTIVAVDKVGNTTTTTITMKPIRALTKSIDDIALDTVNSDDQKELEKVKDKVSKLYTLVLPDDEKEEINDILDEIDALLEVIEEAKKAINTDIIKKSKKIKKDNVQLEDQKVLQDAKSDYEDAIDVFEDHYTDVEKKTIDKELKRIEDALEVIDNVLEVEQMIEDLPNEIGKENVSRVKEVYRAYKALTKYEKSLVRNKGKLDDALNYLGLPDTGDNSRLWMWMMLLLVSGFGMFYSYKERNGG